MNDPHVQALIYVVEHDRSVDYADASPVEVHRCDFTVMVEEGHARITLNRHFASVQEARDTVQPFIDQLENIRPRQPIYHGCQQPRCADNA